MSKRRTQNRNQAAPARANPPPRSTQWLPAWAWLVLGLLLVSAVVVVLWNRATPTAEQPAVVTVAPTPPTRPGRPATAPAGVVDYCRASPLFRDKQGFSNKSVFSTVEKGVKGAIMIEPDASGQATRSYQNPTWADAGYLGHVVFDRHGNGYTFPAPYVSLIDNPPDLQNIIYRIDSATEVMTRFITITAAAPLSTQNPFGIMGLTYDCDSESLYASSVAGSTRSNEVGKIVRVDLITKQIAFEYQNVDAFGLGVYIGPTGKRLYYGATREPTVYSIAVDENGDLNGEPQAELTIPDSNFKARRILFDRDGTMQVRTRPFDYNLIVTSERPEKLYRFRYDATTKKWQEVTE